MDALSVAKFHAKKVSININTGKDETGSDTFTTVEGRILAASEAGIALRSHSNTRIIDLADVLDIEEIERPQRRRVRCRYIRDITPEDSARQHLADRHGIFVTVLNAVEEETAREMHDGIEHADLGHRHGDRPRRGDTETIEDLEPKNEQTE